MIVGTRPTDIIADDAFNIFDTQLEKTHAPIAR